MVANLRDGTLLIASAIELLRSHAGCPVAILTGDINLQNKCEFAGIPFIEPMQETAHHGEGPVARA